MLDMIQKLINEHGSSTILKERLELFNDKYEALESKLKNAIKENELLKKENEQLKAELENKSRLLENQDSSIPELPDPQIQILRLLFSAPDWMREESITQSLGIEAGISKYHLTELVEKKLLKRPLRSANNPMVGGTGIIQHSISDQGRKYVVEVLGT